MYNRPVGELQLLLHAAVSLFGIRTAACIAQGETDRCGRCQAKIDAWWCFEHLTELLLTVLVIACETCFQFSSRWYLCTHKSPCALHPISQKFSQSCLWNSSSIQLIDNGPVSSFQGRLLSTSSFCAYLLQVIVGVMSLALCLYVVSQAPQQSKTQASCESWFVCHSNWSCVVMSRAVHPEFSKVDHWMSTIWHVTVNWFCMCFLYHSWKRFWKSLKGVCYVNQGDLRYMTIVCVSRWIWHIPRYAQLLHPLDDVHLLWNVRTGTCLQSISLVEEVHDLHADCK